MAGNLMAIDGEQVGEMTNAITNYQEEATEAINKIVAWKSNNLQQGFFGEGEAKAVETYLDDTCTQIGKIITFFDEFLVALEEVKSDYTNKSNAAKTTNVTEAQKRDDVIKVNRFQ